MPGPPGLKQRDWCAVDLQRPIHVHTVAVDLFGGFEISHLVVILRLC